MISYESRLRDVVIVVLCVLGLAACGGGGGGGGSSPSSTSLTQVTTHTVSLAWAPNHEKGVNSVGGGYQVAITGQPTVNLPYTSGPMAPTSTVTTLDTGTY